MALPSIVIPKMSAHGGELVLLGIIAVGINAVLIAVLVTKAAGWDVAACLLVLQAIIGAVKDRWNARSADRATTMIANSQPSTGVNDNQTDTLGQDATPAAGKGK